MAAAFVAGLVIPDGGTAGENSQDYWRFRRSLKIRNDLPYSSGFPIRHPTQKTSVSVYVWSRTGLVIMYIWTQNVFLQTGY